MICKAKYQVKEVDAQVVDQEEEDQLFMVTSFSGKESSESWLIDSGCTNHMTYDKEFFEELRDTEVNRVRKVQNLFQMFYLYLKLIKIC